MYIYIIHIFILDMFRKKMYMNMPLDTVIFFVGIYIVTFILGILILLLAMRKIIPYFVLVIM